MAYSLEELLARSGEMRHHALLLVNRRFGDSGLSEAAFRGIAKEFCGVFLPETAEEDFWAAATRHPDVVVVDRERSHLRLEEVAAIRQHAVYPANVAQRRLFFVDRCERLNVNAANSLLKILEEPSARALFLFTARSAAEVLPTISSRCQKVPFRCDQEAARLPREQFEPDDWQRLSEALSRPARPVGAESWWEMASLATRPDRLGAIQSLSVDLGKRYSAEVLQDGVVAILATRFAADAALAAMVRYVVEDVQRWRDAMAFNPSNELWLARILLRFL